MGEAPKPILEFVLAHLPAALKPFVDIGIVYAIPILAFLVILGLLATRRIEERADKASKLQMVVEWAYEGYSSFICNILGEQGKEFVPLFATFFFYILVMNILVVIPGCESPTSRLGMTGALGLTAWVIVHIVGFRKHKLGYFKHFVDGPWWLWWLLVPIHLIANVARMVTLSVRLFGNIFGDDTALAQFLVLGAMVTSIIYVPMPFQIGMMFFVVFAGLIQAVVFTALAAAYMAEALAEKH